MRFGGQVFDWLEVAGRITTAIVTTKRIAIEWEEDGSPYHLLATSDDRSLYRGQYGEGQLNPHCEIELKVFKARSGEVLLMGNWLNRVNGKGSPIVFRLVPEAKAK